MQQKYNFTIKETNGNIKGFLCTLFQLKRYISQTTKIPIDNIIISDEENTKIYSFNNLMYNYTNYQQNQIILSIYDAQQIFLENIYLKKNFHQNSNKIQELNQQILNLETQLVESQQNASNSTQEQQQQKDKIDYFFDQVKQLQIQNTMLENSNISKNQEISQLKNQIYLFEDLILQKDKEIQQLQNEKNNDLQQQKNKFNDAMLNLLEIQQQKESKNQQLQSENEKQKEQLIKLNEILQQKNIDLLQQQKNFDDINKRLQETQNESERKIQQFLQEKETELKQWQKQYDDIEKKLQATQMEKDKKQLTSDEQQARHSQIAEFTSFSMFVLETQNKKLLVQLEDTTLRISKLEYENQQLKSELQIYQKQ